MLAGERKVAADGKEVMLFPLEIMWMTQGEHQGYCMDFQGAQYNGSGNVVRQYHCPLYAPCSCTCVARSSSGDWQVFTSDDVVHVPGIPWPTVISFQIGHDNTPRQIGDHFTQGDLIGHTGTNGHVTGDHVHYNIATGRYTAPWSGQLNNSIHIYSGCYVDDTVIYRGGGYDWVEYGDTPTPPTPSGGTIVKSKFPWVLYARKLRNKYR